MNLRCKLMTYDGKEIKLTYWKGVFDFSVNQEALDKFFHGRYDDRTMKILGLE